MPERGIVGLALDLTRRIGLRRDSAILISSSLLFCCSDLFIKIVTREMPLGQFMTLRAVFCITLVLAWMPSGQRRSMARHLGSRQIYLRSFFEASSVTCFVLALQHLPISSVTSIYMSGPLLTICTAAVLGMTRLNLSVMASMAFAFAGVLLVAMPGSVEIGSPVLLAFLSAVLVAGRDITTKGMPAHIPSSAVTVTTIAGVGLAGVIIGAASETWGIPAFWPVGLTLAGALFTASGNYLVIEAFRIGDPALMSVLRYSTIPIALVLGWLVLGYVPLPLQLVGAAMIVVGASLALRRPRRISKNKDL